MRYIGIEMKSLLEVFEEAYCIYSWITMLLIVPPRGYHTIACSTPSTASLRIVLQVYLGVRTPKTPVSDKTSRQLTRNETPRQRIACGQIVSDLAREFGISVQRIHQILRGRRK